MIDRAWIAARIPHQGLMCLLDAVESWDEQQIVCRATSHALPDNPLRAGGSLGVANAIEYAAQAMAVHGALITGDGKPPRQGYLASVRCVAFNVDRLDDVEGDLDIAAERLAGDDDNILYHFEVRADGRVLLAGRAAVILNAEALK